MSAASSSFAAVLLIQLLPPSEAIAEPNLSADLVQRFFQVRGQICALAPRSPPGATSWGVHSLVAEQLKDSEEAQKVASSAAFADLKSWGEVGDCIVAALRAEQHLRRIEALKESATASGDLATSSRLRSTLSSIETLLSTLPACATSKSTLDFVSANRTNIVAKFEEKATPCLQPPQPATPPQSL
jgi:hypothetical protein